MGVWKIHGGETPSESVRGPGRNSRGGRLGARPRRNAIPTTDMRMHYERVAYKHDARD